MVRVKVENGPQGVGLGLRMATRMRVRAQGVPQWSRIWFKECPKGRKWDPGGA